MAELQPSNGFQHGGGSQFGKWRRTVGDSSFELSTSISVCEPTFFKTGSKMAEIQPSKLFQHDGGGRLGKWRQTVGDTIFRLSMLSLVCASNYIEIG